MNVVVLSVLRPRAMIALTVRSTPKPPPWIPCVIPSIEDDTIHVREGIRSTESMNAVTVEPPI